MTLPFTTNDMSSSNGKLCLSIGRDRSNHLLQTNQRAHCHHPLLHENLEADPYFPRESPAFLMQPWKLQQASLSWDRLSAHVPAILKSFIIVMAIAIPYDLWHVIQNQKTIHSSLHWMEKHDFWHLKRKIQQRGSVFWVELTYIKNTNVANLKSRVRPWRWSL